MTLHFSPMQPDQCPACRSDRVRPISYGFPMPSAMDAAEKDEVVLGGCEIDASNPSWRCLDCHTDIHKEDLRWGNDNSRGTH